ncbi:alpha/beta hydrolase [Sphingomonas sp.]|uniref:alpha/beta hydrolase n=1 Tax=Sphingomonas sp. TaxID=28214 RepID=UPI002DD68B6A|nr:alpha/beta hydrolase [Sphingomonas sp.]
MTIDRRTLIAGSLAALPAARALAASGPSETIALWPGEAPGLTNRALAEVVTERSEDPRVPNRAITGTRRPRIEVFRPAKPNGAAMLVIPGGGYSRIVLDREGYELAPWLAERGITAFVLFYRLPAEGWRDPANTPLADAQRAMRLIRARAKEYGIDPQRVGVMGFSAGGHLCADLATRHGRQVYAPADAADRLSARPAIAAPIYPVVSMEPDIAHPGSRTNLIGTDATATMMAEHSPDRQVTKDTPPLFIVHSHDDTVVPVANAIGLHAAARAGGVPCEMHLFEKGGHGYAWGARTAGLPAHLWPELFHLWAKTHRFV